MPRNRQQGRRARKADAEAIERLAAKVERLNARIAAGDTGAWEERVQLLRRNRNLVRRPKRANRREVRAIAASPHSIWPATTRSKSWYPYRK